MSEKTTIHELQHRRSSVFIDEFVDRYSAMAISWNGDERLHVTFGRDSLEVLSEEIIPDPDDSEKAVLDSGKSTPYRNDVASLTIPLDVAEHLARTLLRMVKNARDRAGRDSSI
ncbi:hypothetical protein IFR35_23580 [Pseudomonas fluorescens]|uniref:hypothetical protein n=1 Tax=Pseudomonas fluorescens TaxID=294 RepID=UPI001783AD5F|nr:hypothetical protein [Pseudomonas fluorescens]MBD8194381.1 hypothetical protein [Pseudomonas fluorescens]MBD8229184.1 hypothetical protein [Pseudomonas fluorescens]MBD8787191.1 hypothetical protein [Pseudomonas fluorescens]MBD8819543.1 hypothetical protein [Pseudomonas fluorescens]